MLNGVYGFFCQAEDGIRDLVRSRGLGDVYKRQGQKCQALDADDLPLGPDRSAKHQLERRPCGHHGGCLLYTSDAADERSSVDLGGRRIIKKKNKTNDRATTTTHTNIDYTTVTQPACKTIHRTET